MAPPPGFLEVRCAGCGETLEVEPSLTEFACPDCGTAQQLPPELMPRRPRRALPLPGRGSPFTATPLRFSCKRCGAEFPASLAAAATSDIAPPTAVPITPSPPAQPSEVHIGCSSQSIDAGHIEKPVHLQQTRGEHHRHSFREELLRVDIGAEIPVLGRLQNGTANPLPHIEESHIESLKATISRPDKRKSIFSAHPESFCARNMQDEHLKEAYPASEAQGALKSSIQPDNKEGRFPNDTVKMHNTQKTEYVVAPSTVEVEQRKSINHDDDVQEVSEAPNNAVLSDQGQVHVATKATGNNTRNVQDSTGNQKRNGQSLRNSSNELPHLRRSKCSVKGSPDLVEPEPLQRIDLSPNQSQSEAQRIEKTLSDPDHSSPFWNRFPQDGSNELDDVDATAPPALNCDALQVDQLRLIQMHSLGTRWTLPVTSSNSWREHEMPHESVSGVNLSARDHKEVHSNPSGIQNQDIDWQLAQETCTDNNGPEQKMAGDKKDICYQRRRKKMAGGSRDICYQRRKVRYPYLSQKMTGGSKDICYQRRKARNEPAGDVGDDMDPRRHKEKLAERHCGTPDHVKRSACTGVCQRPASNMGIHSNELVQAADVARGVRSPPGRGKYERNSVSFSSCGHYEIKEVEPYVTQQERTKIAALAMCDLRNRAHETGRRAENYKGRAAALKRKREEHPHPHDYEKHATDLFHNLFQEDFCRSM